MQCTLNADVLFRKVKFPSHIFNHFESHLSKIILFLINSTFTFENSDAISKCQKWKFSGVNEVLLKSNEYNYYANS